MNDHRIPPGGHNGGRGDRPRGPSRRRRSPWSDAGSPGWGEPDDRARRDPYRGAYPAAGSPAGPRYDPRYHPRYPAGRPPAPPPPPRGTHRPPPPPQRRRASGAVILGRFLSALVAAALVVGSGFAWASVGGKPHNASDAVDQAGNNGVVTQTTDAQGNPVRVSGKGANILVVGVDTRTDAQGHRLSDAELRQLHLSWEGGGAATDTMMILHVPADGTTATAISIPRDTWINDKITHAPGIAGPYSDGSEGPYKANKINSFYASAKEFEREYLVSQGVTDEAELQRRSSEAGRTMLIKVLQQLTGVKIDHYAEVNLLAFSLLSKAVGGVPVCLIDATKDRRSGADFPAGRFKVSGADALAFVRQRHGLPHGDLDRIHRQQAFLAGAAKKILSVGTLTDPSKLAALVDAADRSLVLDSGFDLLTFAQQMASLTSGNINFVTIPTHGAEPDVGTSALHVDPAEVRKMFAELTEKDAGKDADDDAATTVDPAAVTVDIQNGTETPGMAAATGKKVAAAGFERGRLSDYPGTTPDHQQATTTVHYPAGGKAAAQQVAKVIGLGTIVADDDVAAGHLLVIVGTDMPQPASGLRGSGNATALAGTHATAESGDPAGPTGLPDDAINAADPGCVY